MKKIKAYKLGNKLYIVAPKTVKEFEELLEYPKENKAWLYYCASIVVDLKVGEVIKNRYMKGHYARPTS